MRINKCNVCVDGWICEKHPSLGWPHDDCIGPGMPCEEDNCDKSMLRDRDKENIK